MIINLLLNFITIVLAGIFMWLPEVDTLPNIAGYDIDAGLQTAVGYLQSFTATFWPIEILFQGFLFLMGYYLVKILLRFFLGSRSPGTY